MLYIFLLAIAACLVVLWAKFVEPNWIELRRQTVRIPDLPERFDGFTIIVLSDTHFPRWTSTPFLQQAIRLSNATQPDVVFLTGDICDRPHHEAKIVPPLGEAFAGIRSRHGIYAVLGNHDHWLDADAVRRELQDSVGARMMENTFILIGNGEERLAIAGVGDLWKGKVDLEAALADIPSDVPRILLSHNPDVAETMGDFRVDLQVSGHTHGGQVRIPFGPAPRIPSKFGNKYRQGLVMSPTHPVYINRGLCSMERVRFWCRPEVTVLTLRRKKTR